MKHYWHLFKARAALRRCLKTMAADRFVADIVKIRAPLKV
jgi:hypothetical protein